MTRPNLILSTVINSDNTDASPFFNTAALDGFELDFGSILENLGDGPVGAALEADPTSIQAARVVWGNADNGAVLTGSGLGQVSNLEALGTNLENGIASGALDALSIRVDGAEVLALNFDADALTLSSGAQSLSVTGRLPTSMQEIFNFVSTLADLGDESTIRSAATVMRDFDLESVRVVDAGVSVFDATLSNTGLVVRAAGAAFRVDGRIPADSIGSLIDLVADLEDSAAGFNNLNQVPDLAITNLSLTAADGTVLLSTSGPIEELEPAFANVTLQGTDGDDRDVYLDFGTSFAQTVTAQLGAGNDSVEIFGDFGFIDLAPTAVDGGTGIDTITLTDFSSNQTQVDFNTGRVQGLGQTENDVNYTVNFTNFENAEVSGGGRKVVLGNDAANTVSLLSTFGTLEFSGGAGTDILDLSDADSIGSFRSGLTQADLDGFSVSFVGGSTIELTNQDLFSTIRLSDVEQIALSDGAGGQTVVGINQVLAGANTDTDFVVGTSEVDSIKGALGGQTLLGQSGGDFIYGDGIQATQTGVVAGQVYRMYQATLDRAPDGTGYEGWVTGLYEGRLDITQMAGGFVNSREFQNVYGDLENTDFVELLYQNVLGRGSDAGGLQGWLDALASGTSRAGVVTGFSESREFTRTTSTDAADFANSQSEAVWTDEIYRVYRATLDRDPDAGGFQDWAGRLGSGTTFDTMIGGFVNSREFSNTYGDLDNEGFVELLYQNVLDRGSDADGLQGWLDELSSGNTRAGVVRGFSESREFVQNTASDLDAWVREQGTDDTIVAGPGAANNVLSGGLLSDTFVFDGAELSRATIVDFEQWDVLQLNGYSGLDNFDAFVSRLEQNGNDAIFAHQNTQIVFENMTVGQFTGDQVEILV